MATALLWAGGAIVLAAIALLVKQYETRMVLLGSGLVMCILSGNPFAAFTAFASNMVIVALVQNICTVMGFAYVMKITKCDIHLVNLMIRFLGGVRWLLIPGAVLITAFVNISLPSAAGCAAAVGAILIPLMIGFGIHPAMAATAVMAGTFGSMMSPGLTHNAMIAGELLKTPDVMTAVIYVHYRADIVAILIAAASLTILSFVFKENRGYVPDAGHVTPHLEKINILYAIIPAVPVLLLVISGYISGAGAADWGKSLLKAAPWMGTKVMGVPTAMLIGVILGLVVTRTNPTAGIKDFHKGMGDGYAAIMGIIIAAGVFVAGIKACGLQDAFLEALKDSTHMVKWTAGLGPFILAIISGSGDAATLAFNKAITPHAADFGMGIAQMGSIATLGGCLGRTMSPLAGAAIVCAGIAGISPLEIAKRNAPGMIIALLVIIVMLG
jgi:DcuC family C4-dicarboxylate transporter